MRRSSCLVSSLCALVLAAIGCSTAGQSPDELASGAGALNGKAADAARAAQGRGKANAPDGAGAEPDAADAGSGPTLPPTVSVDGNVIMCGDAPCQCNNGVDDDGDGTIDGFDAECTGALDDDESSFGTGIPGDNRDPKWQDCFFDGNSGHGDDRCRYPTGCLTGEIPASDPACAVTEECRNNCFPLTPNGCDCFGCCEVRLPTGGSVNIILSDSCSLEKIGDADACAVCTPSLECQNECGECELCPGKTEADLPEHCGAPDPGGDPDPGSDPDPGPDPDPDPSDPEPTDPEDPPPFECEGAAVCYTSVDCQGGQFCSQGCCIAQIR